MADSKPKRLGLEGILECQLAKQPGQVATQSLLEWGTHSLQGRQLQSGTQGKAGCRVQRATVGSGLRQNWV